MKRLLLLLPFALAACDTQTVLPTAVAPSVASSLTPRLSVGNGPARYQMSSTTYVVNAYFGTYIHTYVLTTNPCNGTQTMTGALISNDGFQPNTTETVTFTVNGNDVMYHAVYDDPFYNGYNYDAEFDGYTYVGPGSQNVQLTVTNSASNYKNHGEYVSQSANKNDAAHSCIGMPIH